MIMVTSHGPRPHPGERGHRAETASPGETPACTGASPCVGERLGGGARMLAASGQTLERINNRRQIPFMFC